jgi:hypothetical protein
MDLADLLAFEGAVPSMSPISEILGHKTGLF